jgi:hypothetical protein
MCTDRGRSQPNVNSIPDRVVGTTITSNSRFTSRVGLTARRFPKYFPKYYRSMEGSSPCESRFSGVQLVWRFRLASGPVPCFLSNSKPPLIAVLARRPPYPARPHAWRFVQFLDRLNDRAPRNTSLTGDFRCPPEANRQALAGRDEPSHALIEKRRQLLERRYDCVGANHQGQYKTF